MTYEDWIFSFHLLFAATLVGSLVMSWIVVASMRTAHTPDATLSLHRVAVVATGTTVVGLVGVITLGIWLAVLRVDFHLWDGLGDRGNRSGDHRHDRTAPVVRRVRETS